jgi:hypothetical protein
VSVRGEKLARITAALLDATSAERDVHESRTAALKLGTQRAVLVQLSGAEERDDRSTEEADARLLPVQVVAFARRPDVIATLAEEIDIVFARLHREGVLVEIPLPTFGDSQGDDPKPEQPYWLATYACKVPYRVAIDDPSVEA